MNDRCVYASNSIHVNANVNACGVDVNDGSNLNNESACCCENDYVDYVYGDVASATSLSMTVVVVVVVELELLVLMIVIAMKVGCCCCCC